jgi:hypothetical protein
MDDWGPEGHKNTDTNEVLATVEGHDLFYPASSILHLVSVS